MAPSKYLERHRPISIHYAVLVRMSLLGPSPITRIPSLTPIGTVTTCISLHVARSCVACYDELTACYSKTLEGFGLWTSPRQSSAVGHYPGQSWLCEILESAPNAMTCRIWTNVKLAPPHEHSFDRSACAPFVSQGFTSSNSSICLVKMASRYP